VSTVGGLHPIVGVDDESSQHDTAGNIYSNIDLWLHGQAEWQASSGPAVLIRKTGTDASFWVSSMALLIVAAAMVSAYSKLARADRGSLA
jgi:hypothetical protein